MEIVLKRAAALPSPRQPASIVPLLRKVLRAMYTVAERLPSSRREVPPEWFHYPLP